MPALTPCAWAPRSAFAPTCTCVTAASDKHEGVTFGKVNTEEQQELAAAFQIMSIPTLMVFRDGIRIYEGAGALPEAALDDLIKQAEALDMDEVRAKIAEMEKNGQVEGE